MKPLLEPSTILETVENLIYDTVIDYTLAAQGADHVVLKLKIQNGLDLIAKAGIDASTDAYVLKKFENTNIKVPRLLAQTTMTNRGKEYPILVMTCFEGKLLKDIQVEKKFKYVKTVFEEINKVYTFKSPGRSGYVLEVTDGKDYSWKEFLLKNLNGENPEFNWDFVFQNDLVDRGLLQKALSVAREKLLDLDDQSITPVLIHTDLNENNIFTKKNDLDGIVDWSDSKYGDPLFDYARFRMNIIHRMNERALDEYWKSMVLSPKEKERENLYYLLNLIEYVNWYALDNSKEMLPIQMSLLRKIL